MSLVSFSRLRTWFAVAAYLLTVVTLSSVAAGRAGANELDALHSQILQRPNNRELNLRFAQLAETSGYLRWALAAYERMILTDPNDPDLLKGLQRIRRKLQPSFTLMTVQLGAQYESNPRYYLPPRNSELQGVGSASLLDERTIGDTRWRTNAVAAGIVHQHEGDLNYGIAGAETGPVLDAMAGWSFRPAVGGNVAYFDRRFYYSEATASGTFENYVQGVYRSVVLRGGYRDYGDFFPSGHGFYVEARGRLAVPNLFGPGSAVIVSPWAVWSDMSGAAQVITPIITELQPGAYIEWGGRVEFLKAITEKVAVGVNFAAIRRDYRNDIVIDSGDKRHDTLVNPGASLIFPNLIATQTDLRFDYRYLMNYSNDVTKRFNDHIVTASVVARFDPTSPPPWVTPTR